ncbi:MAG: hypothetical protein COA79_09255 [Planctomycetota bacterium]|nr:MAG: hypothetical protein COA79_09255 [Planctomycetota bacterium]
MKYFITTICFLIAISFISASDKKHTHKGHDHKAKELKVQVKGTQKTCPISSKKVDDKFFIVLQGQKVKFCSKNCGQMMIKDPKTGFEKLGKLKETTDNVQIKCPVSGEELEDHDTKVALKGRNIYFCCNGCTKDFKKEPEKYLKAMDAKKKKDGHNGHDHKGHKH